MGSQFRRIFALDAPCPGWGVPRPLTPANSASHPSLHVSPGGPPRAGTKPKPARPLLLTGAPQDRGQSRQPWFVTAPRTEQGPRGQRKQACGAVTVPWPGGGTLCVCVCVCVRTLGGEGREPNTADSGQQHPPGATGLKHREAWQLVGAWEAPHSAWGGSGGLPGGGGIPTKWKELARVGGGGGGVCIPVHVCTCV